MAKTEIVCPSSHSRKCLNIIRMAWGCFFKPCTTVHCDPAIHRLHFGGHRLKVGVIADNCWQLLCVRNKFRSLPLIGRPAKVKVTVTWNDIPRTHRGLLVKFGTNLHLNSKVELFKFWRSKVTQSLHTVKLQYSGIFVKVIILETTTWFYTLLNRLLH